MKWIIEKKFTKKLVLNKPVLIEGLPGIGNVGKIVVDFLIDELKPKYLYNIYSYTFPHSVFVTEENLVELPKVSISYVKGKKDLLILSGDVQPVDEEASYELAENIIKLAEEFGCREVITIGGIGLSSESSKPNVYGVGTNKKILMKYKKVAKSIKLKGNKAATIVGAAGLLLGIGQLRGWQGIGLLAETLGHPYYLGLREASAILEILKSIFNLKINLSRLKKEIKREELNRVKDARSIQETALLKKLKKLGVGEGDTSYIG